MPGYYQFCNCCGRGFDGAPGARQYIAHLAQATYYAARMSPEATWALSAKAREFLRDPCTFQEWVERYYKDWTPSIDIIPCAYGWFSFEGMPKAPEYQAWRDEWMN